MEDEVKGAILCNGMRHRNLPDKNCDSKTAIENGICEDYLDGDYPYCSDCFPESSK